MTLSVPLSHALGLGQWDSRQILGHHLGHRLGRSPDSAINADMPVGDTAQAEHDPMAPTLPRWRRSAPSVPTVSFPTTAGTKHVADATAFASEWGAQAQAFGWTVHELFWPAPDVPERPAANYSTTVALRRAGA